MALIDEALKAENASPLLEAFVRSLYQQETTSGKNTATSNRGAVGPMQVIPTTFKSVADEGWSIKNPYQNIRAGIRYAAQGLQEANGDPALAATYYYGGPGGMAKAAKGVAVSDVKNPGAPNTLQYSQEVTARMSTAKSKSDPLGATDLLDQMQGKAPTTQSRIPSPYPTGANKLGMETLLEETKSIGGTPVSGEQSAPGAAPASAIPATVTTPGTQRSFAQKAGRVGLEVAGGIGGGIAGAPLGPYGIAGGAAVGSTAGSLLASATFDPMESPGKEAAFAAGGSLVGSGIGAGFGKLIASKPVREGGAALLKILDKMGLKPTPAQYWNSSTLATIESLGSGSMQEAQQASIAGVRAAANRMAANTAQVGQVGGSIMEDVAIKAQQLGVRVNTGPLNSAAKALAGFAPADSEMQQLAQQVLKAQNGRLPFSVSQAEAITNQQLADAINAANGGQQVATPFLMGAQQIRTRLLEIGRAARAAGSSQEAEAAGRLADVLTKTMEGSLAKVGPELAPLWRAGRSLSHEGFQGEAIQTILSKASVSGGATGDTGGTKLANLLKEHVLDKSKTQLSDVQIRNLRTYAAALNAAEEGASATAFKFVGRGLEMRAVVNIAKGGLGLAAASDTLEGKRGSATQIGAVVILMTPYAISQIFKSPVTFNLLMRMSRIPEGTKAAGTLGNQLLAQMLNERFITPDAIIRPEDSQQQQAPLPIPRQPVTQ